MKEKVLTDKNILSTLEKRSFIEIEPICNECVLNVINLVLEVFTSVHIDLFQIEDNIYCLRISV